MAKKSRPQTTPRPSRSNRPNRPSRSSHPNRDEQKITGVNAAHAAFLARPDDLLRAFLTNETAPRFGPLMAHCAEDRLPYRIVPPAELQKISASTHHEGVCLIFRSRPAPLLPDILAHVPRHDTILALEGVGNPHNLGAILRTAAHFGVRAVWCDTPAALRSTAAYRTAEGGAEHVLLPDGPHNFTFWNGLKALREAGYTIATTSSHRTTRPISLYRAKLPARVVFLLGSERHGLSNGALAFGDLHLRIPGSESVESLNVASATAILLAERWRSKANKANR